MKNREKYPNTDDAVKAFEEHNKHCPCGCTFEEWLEKEAMPPPLGKSIAGMLLGSLMLGELVDDLCRAAKAEVKAKPDEPKPEKPSDDSELPGIECPLCHGKHGEIKFGPLYPDFRCPDCKAIIANGDFLSYSSSLVEFKEWFANLGKAAKKD